MHANGQRLRNAFAALTAILASVLWIDGGHCGPSFVRFEPQDAKELAPASIGDTTGEPTVPGHSHNVQAFDSDLTVVRRQSSSRFEMEIPPLICDPGVQYLHRFTGFPPIGSALPLPGHGALGPPQCRQRFFEETRVRFMPATGRGIEVPKTHVYANGGLPVDRRGDFSQVTREYDKPFIVLALDRDRFDLSLDLAVKFDADRTDVLQSQFPVNQLGATTFGHAVRERIESLFRFETGITRFVAGFHATEEGSKCFVQVTHGSLSGSSIQAGIIRILGSFPREPSPEVRMGHCNTERVVGELLPTQELVPDPPMRFQAYLQFPGLICVGKQAKFERLAHLFLPFEEIVDCPADQFRNAQTGFGGQRLEPGDLNFG